MSYNFNLTDLKRDGDVSLTQQLVDRVIAAIESGTPTPVLTTALFSRFGSRGEDDFANRLLSALRGEFGGHAEKPA